MDPTVNLGPLCEHLARHEQRALRKQIRDLDALPGRLADLTWRGVQHRGGHRSGKVWKEDLSAPALGYWVDAPRKAA